MFPRKPSRKTLKSLCGKIGPGDGEDPRLSREPTPPGRRKARQLCAQVAEALHYALAESCEDDLLLALNVVAVEPAPDASRLLVTLSVSEGDRVDPFVAMRRVDAASGRLRKSVAQFVTRRRAPELSFRLEIG